MYIKTVLGVCIQCMCMCVCVCVYTMYVYVCVCVCVYVCIPCMCMCVCVCVCVFEREREREKTQYDFEHRSTDAMGWQLIGKLKCKKVKTKHLSYLLDQRSRFRTIYSQMECMQPYDMGYAEPKLVKNTGMTTVTSQHKKIKGKVTLVEHQIPY